MDLTSDHIGKTMLRFSIPIVLAFFLQSVYGIVDLLIGQLWMNTWQRSPMSLRVFGRRLKWRT